MDMMLANTFLVDVEEYLRPFNIFEVINFTYRNKNALLIICSLSIALLKLLCKKSTYKSLKFS